MRKSKIILIAGTVVVAVAVGYLFGHRDSKDLASPVVRTYMVAPDRTDEIKAQLKLLKGMVQGLQRSHKDHPHMQR